MNPELYPVYISAYSINPVHIPIQQTHLSHGLNLMNLEVKKDENGWPVVYLDPNDHSDEELTIYKDQWVSVDVSKVPRTINQQWVNTQIVNCTKDGLIFNNAMRLPDVAGGSSEAQY